MKKLKVMTVVGTRPEIIRLSRVLARLDEQGVPTYLENSNARNARLYERAGFVAPIW